MRIRVIHRVGADLPLGGPDPAVPTVPNMVLRIYAAHLLPDSPEPRAVEHAGLAWVPAPDLPSLDWLDADRLLLPELAALLA